MGLLTDFRNLSHGSGCPISCEVLVMCMLYVPSEDTTDKILAVSKRYVVDGIWGIAPPSCWVYSGCSASCWMSPSIYRHSYVIFSILQGS
uniref:Uncharacterized protein n=1 Tax=Picea sitchensis TaxID=3332 RepID=A0A6B9XZA5_PICSI|nr:hypothetical protein Q903MT_gene6833 [Picea sitchensis]